VEALYGRDTESHDGAVLINKIPSP
jgi:hypothetical protein